eukprot:m.233530 g.233530  ORF g.233530 m.233530 type:complete len:1276 (-) comp22456_c0_seq10:102-3929(-)
MEESSSISSLLDLLEAVRIETNTSALRTTPHIQHFTKHFEHVATEGVCHRASLSDFEVVKLIGRGGFGDVCIARHKESRRIFALKSQSKREILKKIEFCGYWQEREILKAGRSRWITKLHYAFQDRNYVHMAMDFCSGGDLVNLMENYELSEAWVRFYVAEVYLALCDLHDMGYCHRDIKPDNVLLDSKGHVKLVDFGAATRIEHGSVVSKMVIGTPEYISPEVLNSTTGSCVYDQSCDFWSLGVLMYELIYGNTPFSSPDRSTIFKLINQFDSDYMEFPSDVSCSSQAKDLIARLLLPRSRRITREEIKTHPFFGNDFSWDTIAESTAPFVPSVGPNEADCANFPSPEEMVSHRWDVFRDDENFSGQQLAFAGFTFTATEHTGQAAADESADASKLLHAASERLDDGDDELRELRAALAAARAEANALFLEKQELQQRMDADSTRCHQVEADAEASRVRLEAQYNKDLQLLRLELDSAKRKGLEQQQLITELSVQRGASQDVEALQRVTTLEARCRSLQQEVAELKSGANRSRLELDDTLQQLAAATTALKDREERDTAETQRLQAELQLAREAVDQQRDEAAQAVAQSQRQEGEIERLRGWNEVLQDQVNELSQALESREASRQESAQASVPARKTSTLPSEEMREYCQELQRTIAVLKGVIDGYRDRLKKAEEEVPQRAAEDLQKAQAALRSASERLDQEIATNRTLSRQVVELRDQAFTSRGQLKIAHERVAELETREKELVDELVGLKQEAMNQAPEPTVDARTAKMYSARLAGSKLLMLTKAAKAKELGNEVERLKVLYDHQSAELQAQTVQAEKLRASLEHVQARRHAERTKLQDQLRAAVTEKNQLRQATQQLEEAKTELQSSAQESKERVRALEKQVAHLQRQCKDLVLQRDEAVSKHVMLLSRKEARPPAEQDMEKTRFLARERARLQGLLDEANSTCDRLKAEQDKAVSEAVALVKRQLEALQQEHQRAERDHHESLVKLKQQFELSSKFRLHEARRLKKGLSATGLMLDNGRNVPVARALKSIAAYLAGESNDLGQAAQELRAQSPGSLNSSMRDLHLHMAPLNNAGSCVSLATSVGLRGLGADALPENVEELQERLRLEEDRNTELKDDLDAAAQQVLALQRQLDASEADRAQAQQELQQLRLQMRQQAKVMRTRSFAARSSPGDAPGGLDSNTGSTASTPSRRSLPSPQLAAKLRAPRALAEEPGMGNGNGTTSDTGHGRGPRASAPATPRTSAALAVPSSTAAQRSRSGQAYAPPESPML